jgi:hypothetical protein
MDPKLLPQHTCLDRKSCDHCCGPWSNSCPTDEHGMEEDFYGTCNGGQGVDYTCADQSHYTREEMVRVLKQAGMFTYWNKRGYGKRNGLTCSEKWSPGDRLYSDPPAWQIASTGAMVLYMLLMAGIPCYLLQQILASTAKSGTIAVHLAYSEILGRKSLKIYFACIIGLLILGPCVFTFFIPSEEQWQEDGYSPEEAASAYASHIQAFFSQFASDVVVLISAGVTLLNTPKRNIPKEVLEDIKSLQIKSPLGSTSVTIMEKLELAILLAYQGQLAELEALLPQAGAAAKVMKCMESPSKSQSANDNASTGMLSKLCCKSKNQTKIQIDTTPN